MQEKIKTQVVPIEGTDVYIVDDEQHIVGMFKLNGKVFNKFLPKTKHAVNQLLSAAESTIKEKNAD